MDCISFDENVSSFPNFLLARLLNNLRHISSLVPPTSNLHFIFVCTDSQGELKVKEDKKHRAKYQALSDSEQKIQFFSARQIACRLLGSRGYLCQKVCSLIAQLTVDKRKFMRNNKSICYDI